MTKESQPRGFVISILRIQLVAEPHQLPPVVGYNPVTIEGPFTKAEPHLLPQRAKPWDPLPPLPGEVGGADDLVRIMAKLWGKGQRRSRAPPSSDDDRRIDRLARACTGAFATPSSPLR